MYSLLKDRQEPARRDDAGLADLLERQHIALVSTDEIIHFAGNRPRQQRIIIRIRREFYVRQITEMQTEGYAHALDFG